MRYSFLGYTISGVVLFNHCPERCFRMTRRPIRVYLSRRAVDSHEFAANPQCHHLLLLPHKPGWPDGRLIQVVEKCFVSSGQFRAELHIGTKFGTAMGLVVLYFEH